VLWAGIGVAMVVSLFMRDSIDLNVSRDRNPTFVQLSDGAIRNGYTLRVANQNREPREFVLSFRSPLALEADIQGLDWLRFEVQADKLRELRLFLTTLPFAQPTERAEVEIWIEDQETRERSSVGTVFLAPEPQNWPQ
jgi:polyferredoxin